jgi:hypothetical protein
MRKSISKRAYLGVESLERRELLSGNGISLTLPLVPSPSTTLIPPPEPTMALIGSLPSSTSSPSNPSMPVTSADFLLVPQVTTGGSSGTATNSKIQIIVPPLSLGTSMSTGPAAPMEEITLRFIPITGPVYVQLEDQTPQAVGTFLDYIESGAFDNALFARLGFGATNGGSMPYSSQATVNKNGSLNVTGNGTSVTLLPTTLTHPTSLMFEFDTSLGVADVQLDGAKSAETEATFMDYIESGAMLEAVIQRLAPPSQTGTTTPTVLDATDKNGSIVLTGGNTGTGETIVLPVDTIVNIPNVGQVGGSAVAFQFITSMESFDVEIPNIPKVVKETITDLELGAKGSPVPVNNNQAILATFGDLGTNPYTDQSDDVLQHDIKALKADGVSSTDDSILDRQEVLVARKHARTLLAQAGAEAAAAQSLSQEATALAGMLPGLAQTLSDAAQGLAAQAAADQAAGTQLAIESGLKNS